MTRPLKIFSKNSFNNYQKTRFKHWLNALRAAMHDGNEFEISRVREAARRELATGPAKFAGEFRLANLFRQAEPKVTYRFGNFYDKRREFTPPASPHNSPAESEAAVFCISEKLCASPAPSEKSSVTAESNPEDIDSDSFEFVTDGIDLEKAHHFVIVDDEPPVPESSIEMKTEMVEADESPVPESPMEIKTEMVETDPVETWKKNKTAAQTPSPMRQDSPITASQTASEPVIAPPPQQKSSFCTFL